MSLAAAARFVHLARQANAGTFSATFRTMDSMLISAAPVRSTCDSWVRWFSKRGDCDRAVVCSTSSMPARPCLQLTCRKRAVPIVAGRTRPRLYFTPSTTRMAAPATAAAVMPSSQVVTLAVAPGTAVSGTEDRKYQAKPEVAANAPRVDFVFVNAEGQRFPVSAPVGQDLLTVAHDNDIDLEGACEGSLACSTCHVILPAAIYDSLPEATDEENDMLDLAFGLTEASRLGCQVRVTAGMTGMEVRLPSATRNMMVDGHKPKHH